MKELQLEQNSPEWHEWRQAGIGGSDAPAVMGESPYRTPLELYREKRGESSESDGDDPSKEFIFAKGHAVEKKVRKEFEELIGVSILPKCGQHEELPFLRASFDGFDPMLGILEVKLVGKDAMKAAAKGEIQRHHWIQMQHQFLVSGVDVGTNWVHDGKTGIQVEVPADKHYIEKLRDEECRFWERIESGQAPALTDNDYLIPDDKNTRHLFEQLFMAKYTMDKAKEDFDRAKAELVAMASHPKMAHNGVKLLKVTRQGSINYKSIPHVKRMKPETLDEYRGKPIETWQVRIGKKHA